MNAQSCETETYPQLQTDYSVMETLMGLTLNIRKSLSNKIAEIGNCSFTLEPRVEMNTDVLVNRQIDDLVFELVLSPRIACEQVRHNGENSLFALRPPYISVYNAYYNSVDYMALDNKFRRIAIQTTNSVGYAGKNAVLNAVAYSMGLLSSDWYLSVN